MTMSSPYGARVDDALLERGVDDAVSPWRHDEDRPAESALRIGRTAATVEPL